MRHNYSTLLVSLLSLFIFSLVNCLAGNKNNDWDCVRNDKNVFYKLRKNSAGDAECATKNPNRCYFTKNFRTCSEFSPIGKITCSDEHKKFFDFFKKRGVVHWCQLTERVIQKGIKNSFTNGSQMGEMQKYMSTHL